MSEELRQLALRVNDAFNRRDKRGFLDCCTDDFSMESRFSPVGGTLFVGRGGLDDWWADLADAWETMTVDIEEMSTEPGQVTLLCHLIGRGRNSGVALDEFAAMQLHVRAGRIARLHYIDRAEAEGIVRGG